MESVELSTQQSLRIAELPEDYRVVGVDGRAPLVRKPTGQVLRIQQNGRLTAATIEAKRGLPVRRADRSRPGCGPPPRPGCGLPPERAGWGAARVARAC